MRHQKINILFLLYYLQMGGGERLVYNIVKNLDREKYNPFIVWFENDEICDEFLELDVSLLRVYKHRRIDISTMKDLSRIIRDNDIRIVNSHTFMQTIYSIFGCKCNNAKLIYTAHSGWEIDELPFYWKAIGAHLFKYVDMSIAISNGTMDCLAKTFNVPSRKLTTIVNGVDVLSYNSDQGRVLLPDDIGISADDVVIGVVANLKRIKNHIFLLKAFKKVLEVVSKVKLLLIGQGFEGDEENTEGLIRNFLTTHDMNEDVLLLGYRADIPSLLGGVDIFCLTSIKEGLPISVIEAMAAGLPVVGTNVTGIRDVVRHNKNGILVDLDDLHGLSEALLLVINSKTVREKMGRESMRLVEKYYSLEKCVDKYQENFEHVLSA